MIPGFNHQNHTPGGNVYWWRYYERKVGRYLTLGTPYVASADAEECFRSWIQVEPRGVVCFGRGTYRLERVLNGSIFRRHKPALYYRLDELRMALTPIRTEGGYVQVADLGGGIARERWTPGVPTGQYLFPTLATHTGMMNGSCRLSGTPDDLVPLDLASWHERFNVMLTGCREKGEFTPLVDWIVENSPESVARLFTEPGVM